MNITLVNTRFRFISMLSLACLTSITHAINPVPGLWGGLLLGGTWEPSRSWSNITNTKTNTTTSVGLGYDILVDFAAQLSYRFCEKYRVEGEILYNKNAYTYFRINDVTFHNYAASTGGRMLGATITGAGFVNGYYDFYTNRSKIVPYIGGGVGYAYVYNVVKFFYNNVEYEKTRTVNTVYKPAVQGIIGTTLFADDYMSFGMDLRYTTTSKWNYAPAYATSSVSTNMQFIAFNVMFNGSFNA